MKYRVVKDGKGKFNVQRKKLFSWHTLSHYYDCGDGAWEEDVTFDSVEDAVCAIVEREEKKAAKLAKRRQKGSVVWTGERGQ